MATVSGFVPEKVWVNKSKYEQAEKAYYEKLAKLGQKPKEESQTPSCPVQTQDKPKSASKKAQKSEKLDKKPAAVQLPREEKEMKLPLQQTNKDVEKGVTQNGSPLNSLAGEVAKARQHIKNSLQCIDDIATMTATTTDSELNSRINKLEKENAHLNQRIDGLMKLIENLTVSVNDLKKGTKAAAAPAPKAQPPKPAADDDDDGVDLFGSDSDEEDAEAIKIKEQRLAEYAARKSKKPALIAKSNIILDVKPWDDETNMKELEAKVREISMDGLLWGASKLVPLAYGIHKLQISCVIEDDKVSVDLLQETIEQIEDYVQSVDIAAFNKV